MRLRPTVAVGRVLVCLLSLQVGSSFLSPAFAQKDDAAKRKLEERLRELERKKSEIQQRVVTKQEAAAPKGEELAKIIERYEKLLEGCEGRKSERCADVMYTLAKLYYDEGGDKFGRARDDYDRRIVEWEKHRTGPAPVSPVPDYSKSVRMYRRLVTEYPTFPRNDEANYQIGAIFLVGGEIDSARIAFQTIVDKTPNSVRASAAHFRLGEFQWMRNDNAGALKHLERVKRDGVTPEAWEQVQYRRAELYYNMADFDKAAELFHSYVEKCDAREYVKCEFREMALEFMAISFSDMPNGATEAMKFFKRVGKKPYEPYVIYTIGMKNRDHGQFDDAIVALETALKNYPFYKDAPIAQHKLVECYVVKKKLDEANKQREKLVDNYGPGSQWFSKNSNERAVIDQAAGYVRKALANICLHYHAIAQKSKDKSAYEKALKRYQEYFQRFPDDKWQIYEFKYYVGEIFNDLGQFDKSVESYWYVAMEDLSKYPEYKADDVDSLLYDDAKQYEEARQKQKQGVLAISQEDAGYNAIAALDKARKQKVAKDNLSDQAAYNLPETQKMLQDIDIYQKRFPKGKNTPEVLYLAGNIHYMAKAHDKAIAMFNVITEQHPKSEVANRAFGMIARSYVSAGQFDLALGKYRELLNRTDPKSTEYQDVVDLAAAALYSKAESMQKSGNFVGAADVFKSILSDYPRSKVADRGWFEAAVAYEQANNHALAAATFEELPVKFSKSTLRERAFVRAAENYKKMERFDRAAEVLATAAATITKADFAVGSLDEASQSYQKMENFVKAGEMYELIFQRYPDDARAPQSLYNAGLIFEKGKEYERAIRAYTILAEKYPKSEFAEEAAFSIGLCYEKMGKWSDAAEAFRSFGTTYSNKAKQVEALVKAGDAYFEMKRFKDAENSYLSATALYDNFKKKMDFDVATVARAYMKLGETYHQQYRAIELKGRNEKEVRDRLRDKQKALESVLKQYASAIETGIQDVVIKSTYLIGESFLDFADALRNQTLFGRKEEQIAGKIKIISSLDKYYINAQEKFEWVIRKAYEECVSNEFVDKSVDLGMRVAYLRGRLFEEVGDIFGSAPVPPGLTKDEEAAYRDILKEKELEAKDRAVPNYAQAIHAAADLGIVQSRWIDSTRARIQEIDPGSEALSVQISAKPPCTPKAAPAAKSSDSDVRGSTIGFKETAPKPATDRRGAGSERQSQEDTKKRRRKK